jgi:hypothetical protein
MHKSGLGCFRATLRNPSAATGDRPSVAFVESKASQSDIAQLDWIALAIPGCIDDALGDHF